MATVLGEEHLCYSEASASGHYTPLVAVAKYDGSVSFRDVVKEDLARISDENVFPGDFIFLFHSPVNEKPIAVIPLTGAKVVVPDQGDKTFDEQRHYRANDGFEFDIRHTSRPTVRLYALGEQERKEWTLACQQRCQAVISPNFHDTVTPVLPPGSNITVTGVKLTGLLLSGTEPGEDLIPSAAPANPLAYTQAQSLGMSLGASGDLLSPHQSAPPMLDRDADMTQRLMNMQALSPAHSAFLGHAPQNTTIPVNSVQGSIYGATNVPFASQQPVGTEQARPSKVLSRRNLSLEKYQQLEASLSIIVQQQQDARRRQDKTIARLHSREAVAEARAREDQNPLTLAELLRLAIFFFDEELAEDPQADSAQQFPHVKGQASEAMILAVYQRYCGESGFMALEQLIELMEDSGLLQTHAPHDDNDEPLEEYKNALDPVRLLYSVPRMAEGIELGSSYYTAHERQLRAQSKDRFIIGFGQFYQILLHIAQIVYPDLYASDATVAFNKILLEVICPMFLWSRGRHKRGSGDTLVLEERILLVLTTYVPNLWRVFLTYCTDAVGKPGDVTLAFPEVAQLNERGMHRLPPLAPDRFYTELSKSQTMDSLIVTEAGCLRFARDFGLTPYLLSNAQLREHFRSLNRGKVIVSGRLPTREQITKASLAVDRNKKKDPITPMHFGRRRETRFGTAFPAASSPPSRGAKGGLNASLNGSVADEMPPPPPPAVMQAATGLSFSEFVELIARIAVDNMQQPNYHAVFPTPFSKVLAMLTVWGVADMSKLAEVRTIRSDDAY